MVRKGRAKGRKGSLGLIGFRAQTFYLTFGPFGRNSDLSADPYSQLLLWNHRRAMAARSVRLGYNVLVLDTDMSAWSKARRLIQSAMYTTPYVWGVGVNLS